MRKAKKPLSSSGAWGMKSRYQRSTSAERSSGQSIGPPATVLDRVQLEAERGDDAEVAAAAAQRPEEIGVLLLVRRDEAAVGEHDVGLEQIVDGQAELAGEMADAAAEGDAADAGGGDDAARRGQTEGVRGVVQIAQQAPPRRRRCRRLGSTRTPFIGERSMTSPSSTVPSPGPLWPPPRMARIEVVLAARS